jgi:hypothetical protein
MHVTHMKHYYESCTQEEDVVRDLIRDTFRELWFSDATTTDTSPQSSKSSSSSSASSSYAKEQIRAKQITNTALQMMEVIARLYSQEWLVKLLSELMLGPGEGDKNKKDSEKHR